MKESKFVRTKIVVGYVLIALIGLTAMIYVWRQTGALLEPDHSQQELRRRRRLVNQTLYHLYEAETYGQMLVAGYASYENRYKRELRLVRECIDSLRMRADDESQQMRLDTIVRLIAGKEQGIKALDRNLRSAGTATLLSENIQRMIPMLDSLSQPTIEPDTILVRDTVRVAPKKKRNFFRRFGDLFSPPKNDSQVVVKTRVRIDAPPRQMSLGDTIAVVLQDLEQRVTSERLALYDKAWREGLRLQRNNQQINQRIYRLIIDFEEEETAYLWERMQAREQVRRSSLVILGSVAAGSLLVMLLFVGILWRDVNRSNRYKRQLEAANRHNEALLEAREKLMLTITHDIKAPLGSIMGYIDLLTRLDLGKRGALYLDHMKSSADHLLELVTDLLDFYKLDSNKVAVNRIPSLRPICLRLSAPGSSRWLRPKESNCGVRSPPNFRDRSRAIPRVCGRSPRTCFPMRSSSPTGGSSRLTPGWKRGGCCSVSAIRVGESAPRSGSASFRSLCACRRRAA